VSQLGKRMTQGRADVIEDLVWATRYLLYRCRETIGSAGHLRGVLPDTARRRAVLAVGDWQETTLYRIPLTRGPGRPVTADDMIATVAAVRAAGHPARQKKTGWRGMPVVSVGLQDIRRSHDGHDRALSIVRTLVNPAGRPIEGWPALTGFFLLDGDTMRLYFAMTADGPVKAADVRPSGAATSLTCVIRDFVSTDTHNPRTAGQDPYCEDVLDMTFW
jgi:hypothetical protein